MLDFRMYCRALSASVRWIKTICCILAEKWEFFCRADEKSANVRRPLSIGTYDVTRTAGAYVVSIMLLLKLISQVWTFSFLCLRLRLCLFYKCEPDFWMAGMFTWSIPVMGSQASKNSLLCYSWFHTTLPRCIAEFVGKLGTSLRSSQLRGELRTQVENFETKLATSARPNFAISRLCENLGNFYLQQIKLWYRLLPCFTLRGNAS